jgi:pimeloyl-ACP methyl ester carboxylesterase
MMLDHHPSAEKLKMPSLVVCGDKDSLVSVQQSQRMAALVSHSGDAFIIPGGEHLLPYVNSGWVNKTLRNFYSSLGHG